MSNNTIIIAINISDNPWISRYETMEFSKSKLQPVVNEIISSCSDKDHYTSAHQYDQGIRDALKTVPDDIGSRRPLYYALRMLIAEQTPKNLEMFMLIEHNAGILEKHQIQLDENIHTKVLLIEANKKIEKLQQDVEKLIRKNGNH